MCYLEEVTARCEYRQQGKILAAATLDCLEDANAKSSARQAAIELKSLLTGGAKSFDELVISALKNWLD